MENAKYIRSLFLSDSKKVYLAAPFFNDFERDIYARVIKVLRSTDLEIYVPREHFIKDAFSLPNWIWGREVFQEDIQAIDDCDEVIVLNYGLYSDSGTAWEQGYAYAKGKRITSVYIDFSETETPALKISLMMANGANCTMRLSTLLYDSQVSDYCISTIVQK